MQFKLLAAPDFLILLRFWIDRRAGRDLPRWDGDVAALPRSLLPNLAIGTGFPDAVYRYLGSECVRRWGGDATGQPVFEVLQGEYRQYVRSLCADALVHGMPIFSAAAFHHGEHTVISGRLFAPFAASGAARPDIVMGLQLFRGSDQPLVTAGSGIYVNEIERFEVIAVPELCEKLEEARRYQDLAGKVHQDDMASRLSEIAAEFVGGTLAPLPRLS